MSRSTEGASESREELKQKFLDYKAGNMLGLDSFSDAEEGEMDPEVFKIRIAVFGITGAGKSALINTIYKVLQGPEQGEIAIVQAAGGEGTEILEEFFAERGFTILDTRGFFDFDTELEETEFFRILYGAVREGESIDRKNEGQVKTQKAGKAGHKLDKPPLSRQVHVVLWVIKGNDIRLLNEDYQDKLNFVLHRLQRESITMLTVISHSDVIDKSDNTKAVDDIISKSREVTKSLPSHTFLIQNWTKDVHSLDAAMEENVLKMLNTALECGERSVKIRQSKRRAAELKAEKIEKQIQQSKLKMPKENTEQLKDKNVNVIYNKF